MLHQTQVTWDFGDQLFVLQGLNTQTFCPGFAPGSTTGCRMVLHWSRGRQHQDDRGWVASDEEAASTERFQQTRMGAILAQLQSAGATT